MMKRKNENDKEENQNGKSACNMLLCVIDQRFLSDRRQIFVKNEDVILCVCNQFVVLHEGTCMKVCYRFDVH